MKIKILVMLISICTLSSCISNGKVKETQNNKKIEKIDIFSINIDPEKFENNTKYLKEYSVITNELLEKNSLILRKNLDKRINMLGEKYTWDKQKILNTTWDNSKKLLDLEKALMKEEGLLYSKYEKDLYSLESEYTKKIEEEVKNLDAKNLEIYLKEQ